MYPNRETYIKWKRTCNVIPFIKEVEGDMETPIRLYRKLCIHGKSFLLESVEGGNKWGRYSYIGGNMYGEIVSKNGETTIRMGGSDIVYRNNTLEVIQNFFENVRFPQDLREGMPPFLGGAVGYVAYDLVREVEKLPRVNPDELGTPDVHLMIMEEMAVYDHLKQKVLLVFNQFDPSADYEEGILRLNAMEKKIHESLELGENLIKKENNENGFASSETKKSFADKVNKAKEYIRKGDIFQVVLSQRLKMQTRVHPFEAYRRLRKINPSPYLYCLNFEDVSVVGSSPELLVKVENGYVETCPIAGTRPRGRSLAEDERLEKELLEDEKEMAEHLMLVDLARNDIGKISKFGSVEVPQFLQVQKFSHVMHIVSNVTGTMKEELGMVDALKACLPAGTLSGAPKVRAMEIIEELEEVKRGIYGGAVGTFGFNGNMDTCITIRTILFKDGAAYVQAGAGIVADSVPEKEYEECFNKARALTETLNDMGREEA